MKQFVFRKFNSENSMMQSALELFADYLAEKKERPKLFLLSGGKTPIPLYELIVNNKSKIQINNNCFFGLTDERMVPYDSPESNFKLISKMLNALNVKNDHIFSVNTSLPLMQAAEDYNSKLASFIDNKGIVQLAFLGLGTDGHTASLFSFEDLNKTKPEFAIPVKRSIPPDRVSITPLLLSLTKLIIFLVTGRAKKNIVDTFLRAPDKVIAGRAVFDCEKVFLWFTE